MFNADAQSYRVSATSVHIWVHQSVLSAKVRGGVDSWPMFNPFRRNRSRSQLRPPRGPGETIRKEDAAALSEWARGRAYIEAFVEPETVVNEMSVVVVDETGQFIRRRIGGPKGIDAVAKLLQCDVYDVEETGYPQRMRERMERERILRKREEQRQRRARFEREHGAD